MSAIPSQREKPDLGLNLSAYIRWVKVEPSLFCILNNGVALDEGDSIYLWATQLREGNLP